MSDEAISKEVLIREYTKELHNRNAAAFIGAGLSIPGGYLDWRSLLKDVIHDLRLDPVHESDLVTVAQYYINQAGGNRSALTRTILNEFSKIRSSTRNHQLLASLPIRTYWTTNYDKLIEKSLEEAKKVPDVKYTLKQLAVTRPDRDVVVYKMHGDVDHSDSAVISKDDYEHYPIEMRQFVEALRGDLIAKTFLFLGFSFSDPNIDYILSRVRVQFDRNQREHYCLLKRVAKAAGEKADAFKSRQLRQHYFIRDLKRFGIQTVLVDEYADITGLLKELSESYKRSSILISGAADVFGSWSKTNAQLFLHSLSKELAARKNRIVTGFGSGVGSAVVNGVLAHLNAVGRAASDQEIVMRPFPQAAPGGVRLEEHWQEYRRAMVDYAGIAIFVFGNRHDDTGGLVLSKGMREEFDFCIAAGVKPLPIGATGFVAEELWSKVLGKIDTYYPGATASFKAAFKKLGDSTLSPDKLLVKVLELVGMLQRSSSDG